VSRRLAVENRTCGLVSNRFVKTAKCMRDSVAQDLVRDELLSRDRTAYVLIVPDAAS
jgi:hypothetical protein